MEIQIDPHTVERAEERGTSEEEIQDVIKNGFSIPARRGRQGRAKIYEFKQERLGKYYEQKRVEVIYVLAACRRGLPGSSGRYNLSKNSG